MSVAANPNCKSREEAERAVNEVWESCFADTRPFDEVCLQLLISSTDVEGSGGGVDMSQDEAADQRWMVQIY